MSTRPYTKLIRHGNYVAEVDITLEDDRPWGSTMSQDDAFKIDDVRQALQDGELKKAAKLARVYRMTPIDTEAA